MRTITLRNEPGRHVPAGALRRRSEEGRLVRHQHEGRLEADLRVKEFPHMTGHRAIQWLVGPLLAALIATPAPALAQDKKPNVVFILADNVGYGDLGPYGGGELRGYPTLNADRLAREGLRFTQFLVEPSCTPSRSALMTGQYSIRNGLSLAAIPGTPNTLSAKAYTMGQLFKDAGYATAIFGKWHLGSAPQSLPGAHGFDEFYGIPPDTSWNDSLTVSLMKVMHSIDAPESALIEKGPWIVQQ